MGPLLHFAGRPGPWAGDATQANADTRRRDFLGASKVMEEASSMSYEEASA
ncbi:MAG TPA: hypothetical protein VMH26_09795 [Burkholderiales bacterium]|nr:hypothetical protein [Burkholderiales bacterium]